MDWGDGLALFLIILTFVSASLSMGWAAERDRQRYMASSKVLSLEQLERQRCLDEARRELDILDGTFVPELPQAPPELSGASGGRC